MNARRKRQKPGSRKVPISPELTQKLQRDLAEHLFSSEEMFPKIPKITITGPGQSAKKGEWFRVDWGKLAAENSEIRAIYSRAIRAILQWHRDYTRHHREPPSRANDLELWRIARRLLKLKR